MKTLKSRIIRMFWLLIGATVIVTGIFFLLLLQSSHRDFMTDRLLSEGEWIADTMDWQRIEHDLAYRKKMKQSYHKKLQLRVRFYDATGREFATRNTISLAKNEPVYSILKNEIIIKHLDQHFYGLFPINRSGRVIGILQLEHETDAKDILHRIMLSLVGGLVLIAVLASLASSRVAIGVIRPLEEMTQVAVDLTKKRFYRRVRGRGNDEVGRLGHAINRMAHHLQKQMNTIRQSEQRLSSVIETLESGLLMVDGTGIIRFANRAFEDIFDIVSEDISGNSYKCLTEPFNLSQSIENCMATERKIREEVLLYLPHERVLEVIITPMWIAPNGVSVLVTIQNMTTVRRLEKMRKDFVANVSHELKTPITSIRGFSETLLDGSIADHETAREFIQIIHDESIRLQRLVGDLLDLSQLESKQMRIHLERAQLDSLIQSVVKTMEDQFRNRRQALIVNIEKPFIVAIDVDGFRQILINLLSNAVAYTPEGGSIAVTAKRERNHWELRVQDTGIGIPQKDLSRVFERFYRVNKDRSRESGGTGLGLAIVKHLVELHQAEIEVQSTAGQGTLFRITFPIWEQQQEEG